MHGDVTWLLWFWTYERDKERMFEANVEYCGEFLSKFVDYLKKNGLFNSNSKCMNQFWCSYVNFKIVSLSIVK